jgi:hypothetical protein
MARKNNSQQQQNSGAQTEEERRRLNKGKTPPPAKTDDDDDDEEEDDDANKALVDEDQLLKSLRDLERTAARKPLTRSDELFAKAHAGTATREEKRELAVLLEDDNEGAGGSFRKGLENNDQMAKAMDVSPFLSKIVDGLAKSLDNFGEQLQARGSDDLEFRQALAKGLLEVGNGVIAVSQQLGQLQAKVGEISAQPTAAPRGVPGAGAGAAPLNKSLQAGAGANAEQPRNQLPPPGGDADRLSKAQVLSTMETMFHKSMREGRGGKALCGIPLDLATAGYEGGNQLSPALIAEIKTEWASLQKS